GTVFKALGSQHPSHSMCLLLLLKQFGAPVFSKGVLPALQVELQAYLISGTCVLDGLNPVFINQRCRIIITGKVGQPRHVIIMRLNMDMALEGVFGEEEIILDAVILKLTAHMVIPQVYLVGIIIHHIISHPDVIGVMKVYALTGHMGHGITYHLYMRSVVVDINSLCLGLGQECKFDGSFLYTYAV